MPHAKRSSSPAAPVDAAAAGDVLASDTDAQLDELLTELEATTASLTQAVADPTPQEQRDLDEFQAVTDALAQPRPADDLTDLADALASTASSAYDATAAEAAPVSPASDQDPALMAAIEQLQRAAAPVPESGPETPADDSASADPLTVATRTDDAPSEEAPPAPAPDAESDALLAASATTPDDASLPELGQTEAAQTSEPIASADATSTTTQTSAEAPGLDADALAQDLDAECAALAQAVNPASAELIDLDQQLATVAGDMLASEAPRGASQAEPRGASPQAEVPTFQTSSASEPSAEPHPVPVSHAGAPSAAITGGGRQAPPGAKAAVQHALQAAAPRAKAAGSWLRAHVEPKVIAGLGVLSKPLDGKPKVVKHSLGLVAVYTLLIASSFWGYALFLRPSHASTPAVEPFDFRTSGLPSPEHAEPEHDDAHAAPAQAAGGHGAADDKKGKDAKKKPVLDAGTKKPVVNKTLDERTKKAKDGKKAEAKSGGH